MAKTESSSSAEVFHQLDRVIERLRRVESHIGLNLAESKEEVPEAGTCGLPLVPPRELEAGIDLGRESLIRSIEKKWVNGTRLKYCFLESPAWGGESSEKDIVRHAFEEWKSIGIGLDFQEVNTPQIADVRIGFQRGDGAWSYVGRDIWSRPANERTMNFGWRLHGQEGRDTALHEVGHTLGFQHEQQNPFAGIVWDEEAVYRYFGAPPNNWPREKTFHNVLRKLDPNSVEGTQWDPNSIMQYSIRAGLIISPEQYRQGLSPAPGLSEDDRERVRLFYPSMEHAMDQLKPFEAKRLDLKPVEQANFAISPENTGEYHIQTFGSADTLMVLFEEVEGELEHFAADDDSGWDRNASLAVRLVKGRNYVLRVRSYFSGSAAETAIMLWR